MHKFSNVFRGIVLAQLAAGCAPHAAAPTSAGASGSGGSGGTRTPEALAIPAAPSASAETAPSAALSGVSLVRVDIEKSDEFHVEVKQNGEKWSGDLGPLVKRFLGGTYYRFTTNTDTCDAWVDEACSTAPDAKTCAATIRARTDGPCVLKRATEQVLVKDGVAFAVSPESRMRDVHAMVKALFPSFRDWEQAWLATRLLYAHAQMDEGDITFARQADRWIVTGNTRRQRVGASTRYRSFKIQLEFQDNGAITDKTSEASSYTSVVRGRRPKGLVAVSSTAASALGRYFANAAHMEGASIASFERLAEELTLFGAPSALVTRARAAVEDERRHEAAMAALRDRYGARALPLRVRKRAPRSLYAFAKENAVEGCIYETYAAIEAHHVCRNAADRDVQRRHAHIARDETRHAELAWDVAAWASTKLTPAQKRRIQGAQGRAARALYAELGEPRDSALVEHVGLPTPRRARALYEAFFAPRIEAA